VWVDLSASSAEVGEERFLLVIARDITDRRRLEEQYLHAQKMEAFGQLAGGVAHDFNNLLTVINGYGEIVRDALPEGDPNRDFVVEITRAGERAAALTRQLLAFSRKQVIATTVLDLNAVVADAEKYLTRLIGEDIDLVCRLQPDLGRVETDAGQIDQVLMNLVINARDAMPTGGKLTVETRNVELDENYAAWHAEARPGRHVLLTVSDSGCGMTDEVKARIFEPFFTTKEKGRGTGLGLAMVFGFVKQSGGNVEVYSEPGVGTSFKIYLPRVEAALADRKADTGLIRARRGTETILLAEDEASVRALTRIVLQGNGYEVLESSDAYEAVRIATEARRPIHLFLTDVVMPGMGGRQLAERLQPLHPEMKVLYLSGYPDDAVVRHGILHESVNFLQKPFSTAALAEKVRQVLDTPVLAGGGPGAVVASTP
jgi:two-component system cell cycle sensor histidine kinase/response regulator CckA